MFTVDKETVEVFENIIKTAEGIVGVLTDSEFRYIAFRKVLDELFDMRFEEVSEKEEENTDFISTLED